MSRLESPKKLQELKDKGVVALAFDYDGTLYQRGTQYDHERAFDLIAAVRTRDIAVGVFSSRQATFERLLDEQLGQSSLATPFFFGGGNGSQLSLIQKGERKVLYSHLLNDQEIQVICQNIAQAASKHSLNPEGLKNFKDLLKQDWTGYLESDLIIHAAQYKGLLFIERSKISFVLPSSKPDRQELINSLSEKLGKSFVVLAGDQTYAHISKRLEKDGKCLAIAKMLKRLKSDKNHLGVFANMPHGNDRVMLSSFPYAFTNDFEFEGKPPPYVLPFSNPPVRSVHTAVSFLISR